ncbi:MAG TPA: hypothetical protein VGS41_12710, partial [Chthonomonadales bacterium]|nr:hypothetical protein [Chthonomonadales bacterium]
MAHLLQQTADIRAIGPLAHLIAPTEANLGPVWQFFTLGGAFSTSPIVFNDKQRNQIAGMLVVLLNSVNAGSAATINEKSRAALEQCLGQARIEEDAGLIVAAIHAFTHIEDGRIARVVEGLANM